MSIFKKLIGDTPEARVKKFDKLVEEINSLEPQMERLAESNFPAKTKDLKNNLGQGKTLDDILPEAFAVVREVAKRTLGERHYDVQLIGGAILHKGMITEMMTGEGKTLVATLPAYLNALSQKGVHIVTVNDYLARRDGVWMGQIYTTLGLSVGVINHDQSYLYDPGHTEKDKERDEKGSYKIVYDFLRPCSRKEAYDADITYGTNSEFGFDYLRDNLAVTPDRVSQRGYHFALIDEVDSILIDEAKTPLIISAAISQSESLYGTFAHIASKLKEGEDYEVEEKLKSVTLTESGIEKTEKALGVDNIYTEGGIKYVHHLETAVRAKALFKKEKEYVVRNNEIIIVDESTGRMQPGRRWSEGLHQAIEAKEGVKVQQESRTQATVTYQNYFRMYQKLSGMTGTALTSAEEFEKVYGLEVLPVPTNRPVARIDHPDFIFQNESGKYKAIAKKIKEINEKGQPVLVGTTSVEKNEFLGKYLEKEGVKHEILNAKNHEREGEIIAKAGTKGSVTIATNMAGRGVDVKLGGPEGSKEDKEEIKNLGGLFVLGTERHEARRIDNQLRGRSGRQGDPGETHFYVSLEDPLMRIFGSERIKNMMGTFGIPEEQPIESRLVGRSIESAQSKIEGLHFDARKHILEYDDVMDFQRKTIYKRRNEILFGGNEAADEIINRLKEKDPEAEKVIKEKTEELGEETFLTQLKILSMQIIDSLWIDHLETMDYLRSSVRLRAYGQRDPLVEYKKEGLHHFRQMEEAVDYNIVKMLPNLGQVRQETRKEQPASAKASAGPQSGNLAKGGGQIGKIGRNDPCHCGSGKKYKKCCMNL